jgi:hypothetical protein
MELAAAAVAPPMLTAAMMAAMASLTVRAVKVVLMFLNLFSLVAINVRRGAFRLLSVSEGLSIAGDRRSDLVHD